VAKVDGWETSTPCRRPKRSAAPEASAPTVRMPARREPRRAEDLKGVERVKATVIFSRQLREELRDEVRRREILGERADVSSIVREACRMLLEDDAGDLPAELILQWTAEGEIQPHTLRIAVEDLAEARALVPRIGDVLSKMVGSS